MLVSLDADSSESSDAEIVAIDTPGTERRQLLKNDLDDRRIELELADDEDDESSIVELTENGEQNGRNDDAVPEMPENNNGGEVLSEWGEGGIGEMEFGKLLLGFVCLCVVVLFAFFVIKVALAHHSLKDRFEAEVEKNTQMRAEFHQLKDNLMQANSSNGIVYRVCAWLTKAYSDEIKPAFEKMLSTAKNAIGKAA